MAKKQMDSAIERKKRFAREYVIDRNGTQAAIRASYSPKTAHAQASRLLKDVEVQGWIKEAQERLQKRVEYNQEWVVSKLGKLASAVDDSGEPLRDAAMTKSLEMLGKTLGMFTDKLEVKQQSVEHLILSVMEEDGE